MGTDEDLDGGMSDTPDYLALILAILYQFAYYRSNSVFVVLGILGGGNFLFSGIAGSIVCWSITWIRSVD